MQLQIRMVLASVAAAAMLAACAHHKPGGPPAPRAAAAIDAGATSPPGDIPDTQQFVTYSSPHGYHVLFPEGWARTAVPGGVTFAWHFDGEQLLVLRASASPAPSPGNPVVAAVLRGFRSVRGAQVGMQRLPGGVAVVARFTSQSQPDALTGRRIALENQSYIFHRGGQAVVLNLWAPAGSDNVDQWRRISRSFAWK